MSVAVISDIHFNTWSSYAKLIGNRNSRLLDQANVLKDFTVWVQLNNIKYVLVCGDIFHTAKVPAECLMVAHESFSELARHAKIYFLVGNHDCADRASEIHAISFLSNYGTVIDKELFTELTPGVPLCGLPYTEDKERLERFLDNVPRGSLVMMHQGISNIAINSKGFTLNELLNREMIESRFSMTEIMGFSGHYHEYQKVLDRTLYIPGSVMQFNWGDKGDDWRGWMEVDLDEWDTCKHKSKAPKFIEANSFEELSTEDIRGNYIRLIGTAREELEDNRSKLEEASSIEFVYKKPEVQYEKISEVESFQKMFDEYLKTSKLSADHIKIGRELVS